MSKKDNLKDYLTDLYKGIASKKPNASRNPQDFRAEIESIEGGGGSICHTPHVYHVEGADNLPSEANDASLAIVTEEALGWAEKSWNGYVPEDVMRIWRFTDGVHCIDPNTLTHYKLNGDKWEAIDDNSADVLNGVGLSYPFVHNDVWYLYTNKIDNGGEYFVTYSEPLGVGQWGRTAFSIDDTSLLANDYNGCFEIEGDIYLIVGENYLRMDFNAKKLIPIRWESSGSSSLYGNPVWTDGIDTYYYVTTYVPSISKTVAKFYKLVGKDSDYLYWVEKQFNGSDALTSGGVWTDGTNVYYSGTTYKGGSQVILSFVLNGDTWEEKDWVGYTPTYHSNIWTDGKDMYSSSWDGQYVMTIMQKNTLYSRVNGKWISEEDNDFVVTLDSALPIEVSTAEKMNALLTNATEENIGAIYKYTGQTTSKYKNGKLYIIAQESE